MIAPDLPNLLHPGAVVWVWAPSSPASVLYPRRFDRGVQALRAEGYDVQVGPSCGAAIGISTLDPRAVADELHEALESPDVAAVVAAVGGWTMISVLPHLDLDRIRAARKPIVGYSDITSLLNVVAYHAGLVAFHGPMVLSEWGEANGPWEYTQRWFHNVLDAGQEWRTLLVDEPQEWSDELLWWDRDDIRRRAATSTKDPRRTIVAGAGEGRLWGGSLIAMGLLAGTPLWPASTGCVVVLEIEAVAPDEYAARLTHLAQAGAFDRAVGVVLGRTGRPRATASGWTDFDSVVRDAVPRGVPVAAGFDVGHPDPMTTLPIGGLCRLQCDAGPPTLELLRE